MAEKEELELLDLEDDAVPGLPENNPFEVCARPKRPWLLFGAAIVVIALAAYIIIRVIGKDADESVDLNIEVAQPVAKSAPAADSLEIGDAAGAPVRVVEDRADAKFNPGAAPKVEAPKPRPINKQPATAPRPAAPAKPRPAQPIEKPVASAATSGWAVQFGSYATREGALAGQRRIQSNHASLFADRNFVVLAAQLPDGSTTYRLRVTGFGSSSDANGFCRNAKSDGLECYVAR